MKFNALIAILLLAMVSCKAQPDGVKLNAKAFQEKLLAEPNAVLLDVRSADEFAGGYIKGAQNIDYNSDQFNTAIAGLDHAKTYFVYCLSGGRSGSAAAYMRKNGFKAVYELTGGTLAWRRNSLPLEMPGTATSDKISTAAYQQMISAENVVLIDFYAPWCGPCKQMEPMLAKLADDYKGKAKIIRINIDENKALSDQLNINEIPFFKLYRNGEEVWHHIGALTREELVKQL